MTTLQSLLPQPDEAPRCAPFAREIELDPGGSALSVDLVLLVDVPRPWPKPVGDHPLLDGVMGLTKGAVVATRLLASVPPVGSVSLDAAGSSIRVVGYRRTGGTGERTRYEVPDNAGLVELVAALVSGDDDTAMAYAVTEEHPPTTALLICTQGSHDVCCGSEGVRLADFVDREFDGEVELHRVSHTGGHRYAPTAMTLPDGRMWAFLTENQVRPLIERRLNPADIAQQCRGWWGAPGGFGQMAERAVFAAQPWAWCDEDRMIEVAETVDGGARCSVTSGDRRWNVDVVVNREVPSIACRAAGGLPAKPGVEYAVSAVIEQA